jgi:hypothetical protein
MGMKQVSFLRLTMTLTLTLSHRMGEGKGIGCHGLTGGCQTYAVSGFR